MIGENKPGPSRKAPVPWDSNDIPESPGGPGRGRRCRARARRTPSRSLVHAAAWGARPDTHAAGWPCPPAERDRRGRTKRPALPLRDGGARGKAPRRDVAPFPGLRLPPSDLPKGTGNSEISSPSRAAKWGAMDFGTQTGAAFPASTSPPGPRAAS